ncbi:MAG: hypothetical protein ACOYMF_10380 [Bacteroidales bacterium]
MFSQIATHSFLKYLLILAISSVKFIFAPPLSFGFGFTFLQTWFVTTMGGIAGVVFFFYLSKGIIALYFRYFANHLSSFYTKLRTIVWNRSPFQSHHKKVFTFRNKSLVKIRQRYGLTGIIILTPILLSIPLGTFLAIKYYSRQKNLLGYLSLSVIVWSLLISSAISIL